MSVRVGVTGAAGRMGRRVLGVLTDRDDCEVAFAVNRSTDVERLAGIEIESALEIHPLLEERDPDAVIDFTGPQSALEYAAACAEAGVPFVTGTTGFSDEDKSQLEAYGDETALLHSPNFARGVQALLALVGDAVASLPGYDVELVETHHNGKRDAPSGTANRLLEEIESAGDFTDRVHGREGEQPRRAGEIGVHALRAGNVTGEHEVVLAGNHEELRLTHRAEDRGVFAAGAVDAAVWLAGQEPGRYDFSEVLSA
ncbi:4-hydroxy-tetrahydrodipicolinate reductase [Natronosalvus rutilus]|uniref:4-hydroxy-tetrahydrodipicolinate reductase n=1 Tax=Natronosalvus rutilus TaxID=2953753 RepID=A0A9E7SUE4_9EURY|nr:4-hydroxy-tetrahydrodipicolinate reductase [Natronosalvus rutilus]UTF54684.1 4-hydroxy-tetrahydrodipicolinate reductase [Natronosalvus rutilus]